MFLSLVGWMCLQDSAQDLRWKLASGDVLVYDHRIEQTFSLHMEESPFEYTQVIDASERLDVERVTPEGEIVVRYTLASLKVTVDGKTVYDSDQPNQGDPQAVALFRDALSGPQTVTVTSNGRLAGGGGSRTTDRFRRAFAGEKNPQGGTLPLAFLALPLPQNGERTWDAQAEEMSEQGVSIRTTTTYSIEGKTGPDRAVRGATKMSLENSPAPLKLSEGAGGQHALFDEEAGMLRDCTTDFSVTLEKEAEGKVVKVVNSMKSTTKLRERTKK